jgi:hypothetical protein
MLFYIEWRLCALSDNCLWTLCRSDRKTTLDVGGIDLTLPIIPRLLVEVAHPGDLG